jgi:outer membrane protein OmpA-like peptidoglycan-associated protein
MWRYAKPRACPTDDLDAARHKSPADGPRAGPAEPEQSTSNQFRSQRESYFAPSSYPPQTISTESLTIDSFDSDQSTLTGAHQQALRALAHDLKKTFDTFPDSFVTIVGHTDATDTELHNRALGQQRADAVAAYLMAHDAPADKLRAYSLGETSLLVETQKKDPRNRRVEITVFKRNLSYRPILPEAQELWAPTVDARPILPSIGTLPGKIPGEEDDYRARARENEKIAKAVDAIRKREAAAPKDGRSVAEVFGSGAQDIARALGLPEWAVEKARELGEKLPAVGLQSIFDQIVADKSIDDPTRGAIRKVLESLPRIKAK